MDRFAISCLFHNTSNGITYHAVSILTAYSKEEAEGKALNHLLVRYPVEQGWTGHSTIAMKIPENL